MGAVSKRSLIALVVAAVVIGGAIIGISVAGGEEEAAPPVASGVERVRAEFAGVPERNGTLGDPDAPIEIIEYGDISCPVCAVASEDTVPGVVEELVRTGEATLTFRPIAFISASSQRGALAAEAAAMQDRMWELITLIYANQGPETEQDWLTDAALEEAVAALGLDAARWRADYDGDEVVTRYERRMAQAQADEVPGTPHFVVRGPRGEESFSGVATVAQFREAIAKVG